MLNVLALRNYQILQLLDSARRCGLLAGHARTRAAGTDTCILSDSAIACCANCALNALRVNIAAARGQVSSNNLNEAARTEKRVGSK